MPVFVVKNMKESKKTKPSVKEIESQLNALARDKGRDVTTVFVDLLDG